MNIIMDNTTSISDLPINNDINNISNVVQENNIKINNPVPQQNNIPISQQNTNNEKDYNQIINDIQNASINGQTTLPSRDIPQDTSQIINDPSVQANYIPQNSNIDYINNDTNIQEIINNNDINNNNQKNLEKIFEEFQIPIIISILFFLFQLPIVKKYLYTIVPSLYLNDGNPNLYGYILNSILFGLLYYIISKFLYYFSNF